MHPSIYHWNDIVFYIFFFLFLFSSLFSDIPLGRERESAQKNWETASPLQPPWSSYLCEHLTTLNNSASNTPSSSTTCLPLPLQLLNLSSPPLNPPTCPSSNYVVPCCFLLPITMYFMLPNPTAILSVSSLNTSHIPLQTRNILQLLCI